MPQWFNVAGPCQADIHYTLPPLVRLPELDRLVERRGYFVDETLISLLRQLRSGYPYRPQGFPHSLALVGVCGMCATTKWRRAEGGG